MISVFNISYAFVYLNMHVFIMFMSDSGLFLLFLRSQNMKILTKKNNKIIRPTGAEKDTQSGSPPETIFFFRLA